LCIVNFHRIENPPSNITEQLEPENNYLEIRLVDFTEFPMRSTTPIVTLEPEIRRSPRNQAA
jgi:hypothetical protein